MTLPDASSSGAGGSGAGGSGYGSGAGGSGAGGSDQVSLTLILENEGSSHGALAGGSCQVS